MSTLQPGDTVRHPKKGHGLIGSSTRYDQLCVWYLIESTGTAGVSYDLTGWERAEFVKPGHVQVRVDDLHEAAHPLTDLLSRARGAWVAWAESHKEPENPETLTDSEAPNLTTDEQPASATRTPWSLPPETAAKLRDALGRAVTKAIDEEWQTTVTTTVPCPWCDGSVNMDLRLERTHRRAVTSYVSADGGHTCPPLQPDEPTSFGARVTLTRDGVAFGKWLRSGVAPRPFVEQGGARASWAELCKMCSSERYAITLGWDD